MQFFCICTDFMLWLHVQLHTDFYWYNPNINHVGMCSCHIGFTGDLNSQLSV